MVTCLKFYEPPPSVVSRNACVRCGRTKEWHEIKNLPEHDLENKAREIAKEWLAKQKLEGSPQYELFLSVIVAFLKDYLSV